MDRQQQQRRTSTWVENTLGAVATAAFGFFFAWLILNWLMAVVSHSHRDGSRVMGECFQFYRGGGDGRVRMRTMPTHERGLCNGQPVVTASL